MTILHPGVNPVDQRWLKQRFRQAWQTAAAPAGRVNLVLVCDRRMAGLHRRYKSVAGTTDVLTFDLRESPTEALDADLVLCVDEARRQAAGRGHALRCELLLYAVHGLLHLMGYDDHTAAGARAMHVEEDRILNQLGVGPVYARRPAQGA